jgi:threonine dehydrogenase-like Zn-dependent dehydrogenase
MRALVFDGSCARVVDRPKPAPRADMALVRVALAGVCRTDLELCRGYMKFRGVLGHEFVGRVVEGPPEWRDQRVVGEINFACGQCDACAQNLERHCPTRRVMGIDGADGAMAELVAVPVANLHRVPDAVADEQAVFVEPLAAAFEILAQYPIEPGAPCLVLGDGKLGLLVAQVLHAAGARVTALGRHDAKLAVLARRGIATARSDAFSGPAAAFVVEATGSLAGFRRAVALTRPRGTLVLKSTVSCRPGPARDADEPLDLAPIVVNEINVIGSRCGPFPPALRALESGDVEVASLVTACVPLAQADKALARAAEPGALKVLIDASS